MFLGSVALWVYWVCLTDCPDVVYRGNVGLRVVS